MRVPVKPPATIVAGLHPVRGLMVNCHVLVDEQRRATIIDSGFIGHRRRFERLFVRLDLSPRNVDAILLTHGHIDHTANLAWLKAWTGAPVYAHPLEQAHIAGVYRYRGAARLCGLLEATARLAIRYRPATIDRTIGDGDELPFWGGLRVVHLPGHTLGHCGFWSERHRLLFAGDLVAIWPWRTIYPPFYFNVDSALVRRSAERAAALRPALVVPNHYLHFDPAELARRFIRFAER